MSVEDDDDTVCFYCGYPDCRCDDFDDDPDDLDCTFCGGDGIEENDDPLWYGFDRDWIPCRACDGTGSRKHQTIF